MVTFGTNQGPIVPRQKTVTLQPKTIVARSPAPVAEERDDIPDPNVYRAPVPHQYRTKIYAVKPNPNLILGTPLDQKYTPTYNKYQTYKKQQLSRSFGLDYTGPHIFEKQDYEFEPKKRSWDKPRYYQVKRYDNGVGDQGKYVPQIGVIYSAGVRYYVPQIYNEEQENSVYDKQDDKYYQ